MFYGAVCSVGRQSTTARALRRSIDGLFLHETCPLQLLSRRGPGASLVLEM